MNPTAYYELRPGEWDPDPLHVTYGCAGPGLWHPLNTGLGVIFMVGSASRAIFCFHRLNGSMAVVVILLNPI